MTSEVWFSIAGLVLGFGAGMSHLVFPEYPVLPPLLSVIAGWLLGASFWRAVYAISPPISNTNTDAVGN